MLHLNEHHSAVKSNFDLCTLQEHKRGRQTSERSHIDYHYKSSCCSNLSYPEIDRRVLPKEAILSATSWVPGSILGDGSQDLIRPPIISSGDPQSEIRDEVQLVKMAFPANMRFSKCKALRSWCGNVCETEHSGKTQIFLPAMNQCISKIDHHVVTWYGADLG